ncbi:hypothetical protein EYF80_049448 [Liparis tanakae]|uniref:Uncharacterized protein n=1 Tax=Liparis tanakae TaxID=230148 RepID=A0A4Z2FHJ7_9TELE|nr:hypothetical protein EYF80_049448 [Liparis tanakae]
MIRTADITNANPDPRRFHITKGAKVSPGGPLVTHSWDQGKGGGINFLQNLKGERRRRPLSRGHVTTHRADTAKVCAPRSVNTPTSGYEKKETEKAFPKRGSRLTPCPGPASHPPWMTGGHDKPGEGRVSEKSSEEGEEGD